MSTGRSGLLPRLTNGWHKPVDQDNGSSLWQMEYACGLVLGLEGIHDCRDFGPRMWALANWSRLGGGVGEGSGWSVIVCLRLADSSWHESAFLELFWAFVLRKE
jgi:hypothetical protein